MSTAPHPAEAMWMTRSGSGVGAAATFPKAPILDWRWLAPAPTGRLPSVADLPHRAFLTSGRAALRAALRCMHLPPGSGVLVATYHCPTMVAPILVEGLRPLYFPIGPDGLPRLDAIAPEVASQAKAMFVAHYFGLPAGLDAVRGWCDGRGIALVEDCAHSYFGTAGERPIGAWGDYATASLSKFFPISEGGLLASARAPLPPLQLSSASWGDEGRGIIDPLENAHLFGRLAGLSHLLGPLFRLKRSMRRPVREEAPSADGTDPAPANGDAMMVSCDMDRSLQRCAMGSRVIHGLLASPRIVQARQRNYLAYARALDDVPGATALHASLPNDSAPYVFPLLVRSAALADRVYARMRLAGLPVFRWDRLWPGTPRLDHDHGALWSHQLLQLLCHQDLHPADIECVCAHTRRLLAECADSSPE